MMFLFGNLSARDARTIPGSARASRAVSGALAGNTSVQIVPFGEAPNGPRERACAPQRK
jgi:hypothetical protein